MRNIADIANQMKSMTENEHFILGIDRVLKDASYTAPEAMYLRWKDLHSVMLESLNEDDRKWSDNDIEIVSIFSTYSVEEIKNEILTREREE